MELTEGWFQSIIDKTMEDVELVMARVAGSRRRRIICLYIDHPDGVTHELCARVSTVVGDALDEEAAVDGPYTLEVSSPGIERPLRKRSHFEAQVGKNVYVKTRVPVQGRKIWQGILKQVGSGDIDIEEAGEVARIPLGEIVDAHLKYEFR
ncbi:MAG: ribosome maturation factor RimP [Thermoleophilia bacterium]